MATYKMFEIRINNAKNGKTEYRDYAITVKNEADAFEAVERYAKACMKRYRQGSTYTITASN